jgi:hypothetical protein
MDNVQKHNICTVILVYLFGDCRVDSHIMIPHPNLLLLKSTIFTSFFLQPSEVNDIFSSVKYLFF